MTCTLTTSPIFEAAAAPGVDSRLDSRHIADHEHGHQTAADLLPAGHLHVRRLEGCIGCFDHRDETFGLDHSECFHGLCHRYLLP